MTPPVHIQASAAFWRVVQQAVVRPDSHLSVAYVAADFDPDTQRLTDAMLAVTATPKMTDAALADVVREYARDRVGDPERAHMLVRITGRNGEHPGATHADLDLAALAACSAAGLAYGRISSTGDVVELLYQPA